MKIAVFYHGLFSHGTPREVRPAAFSIIHEAMECMEKSGLTAAADEIHTCFNGSEEEELDFARLLVPVKAQIKFHGPDSFAENLTLVEIEKWVPSHPGWYVLYFHAKGCTHPPESDYAGFAGRWRRCMLSRLVLGWQSCVWEMDGGAESVGCHWLTGMGSDRSQNIWAGNFWWAKTEFLMTLPSIYKRERIKQSGIAAAESRYEAEVWIGNGPRLPIVRDMAGHGVGGCP